MDSSNIISSVSKKYFPYFLVTDMCQGGYAIETIGESKDGYDIYHVTLRVRTQEDNCICLVFVENEGKGNLQTTIEPFMALNSTSASTKKEECGLELNLGVYNMNTKLHNLDKIGCISGQTSRSLSFPRNGVLRITSNVIRGNLTRGYCIDVQRGELVVLKI